MTDYDVLYYWVGGRERGRWQEATYNTGSDVDAIERMGYVVVRGVRRIGPPDSPPDDAAFKRLGL